MKSDLSVSVVSYNSEKELNYILGSLKNSEDVSLHPYFIDNHSSDNSLNVIKKSGIKCSLITLEKNLGFGAANNIAIKQADSRYHLIANPDISFGPKLLKECADFMDKNPDIAIMTPRFIGADGREQFTPKLKPTLPFVASGFIESKTGRKSRMRSRYTLRDDPPENIKDIDFCAGCFMLCRTKWLKACGGFDDGFFLFFEDADLTLRMQKYGRTVLNPDIYVNHLWNRGNHKLSGLRHEISSMVRFMFKWRG